MRAAGSFAPRALAAGALALIAPCTASAATITVNSNLDTAANDGTCVLREAITSANTNTASGAMVGECAAGQGSPTVDTIDFNITGAGPHAIIPAAGGLPSITSAMTIDGGATDPDAIELDGASAGSGPTGLNIGSTGDGTAIRGLAIYNFGADGITVLGDDVVIEDNFLGTDSAGAATTLGNDDDGITVGAADAEVRDNVISGNGADGTGHGIDVTAAGDRAMIAGNLIGTDVTGTADVGNDDFGINQSGALDVTIGGPLGADMNLISGNGSNAIFASTAAAVTGFTIQGNRIGTRGDGAAALFNGNHGIEARGPFTGMRIADNVIAADTASVGGTSAVRFTNAAGLGAGVNNVSEAVIAGNLIGVNAAGTTALGAGTAPAVSISGSAGHPATDNTVGGVTGLTPGGACTGDCNVIAAADSSGVEVGSDSPGTAVLGNHVGTDAAGSADLGNGGTGVRVDGSSGVIVGSPAAPNLISGNSTDGVELTGSVTGTLVRSNLIGTATNGTTPLANGQSGVRLAGDAAGNVVGGSAAGEGNLIARNAGDGVRVADDATDNAILGNSMLANGELGIDLNDDGVTVNDGGAANDGDSGPNELQNFPELRAAVAGGSTAVSGTLDSAPDTDYRIEVFTNDDNDPTAFGEGQTLLGAFEVTTGSGGVADFAEVLDGTAGASQDISATATELDGDGDPLSTSEFGPNAEEGCDVTGSNGSETVTGTSADEVICALGGDDVIVPGGGDDVVVGGDGTDELDLSDAGGAVELDLGTGTGSVAGEPLAALEVEDVTGGDSDDEITGGNAANVLKGGNGADELEGGDGDDTLKGGDSSDTLKGQDGDDTLKGEAGKDTVKGGDGGDTLKGGDKGDTLKGEGGKDSLLGEDGDDTLKGGDKGDELKGGDGDDTLDGEGGKDDCSGGSGSDKVKSC